VRKAEVGAVVELLMRNDGTTSVRHFQPFATLSRRRSRATYPLAYGNELDVACAGAGNA
jgi:hypothetical protein